MPHSDGEELRSHGSKYLLMGGRTWMEVLRLSAAALTRGSVHPVQSVMFGTVLTYA
jgi:hypothetical protein